jgi:hypothetical protein
MLANMFFKSGNTSEKYSAQFASLIGCKEPKYKTVNLSTMYSKVRQNMPDEEGKLSNLD